jgi:hypothetical protein
MLLLPTLDYRRIELRFYATTEFKTRHTQAYLLSIEYVEIR